MKKVWIILSLITMSAILHSLKGQNLVPNPSFEDTTQCPDAINQVDRAFGWSSYRLTPDYFNSCSSASFVEVPYNYVGYQTARTGNAYIGFYSYYAPGQSPRECVGVKLIQPLVIGQEYFVSFYVSRAVNNSYNVNIASNKIGARFSTTSYSYASPVPIDNFAHVYTDTVIADTSNWEQISNFFIADSAYQYLSIGNFFNDSATTYVTFDSSAAFAYYYLDDILVKDSISTGINENHLNGSIETFPNLVHDELAIDGSHVKSVIIFDALGKKRTEYISAIPFKKINISNLSNGIYFIRVKTRDGFLIKKIIKQ